MFPGGDARAKINIFFWTTSRHNLFEKKRVFIENHEKQTIYFENSRKYDETNSEHVENKCKIWSKFWSFGNSQNNIKRILSFMKNSYRISYEIWKTTKMSNIKNLENICKIWSKFWSFENSPNKMKQILSLMKVSTKFEACFDSLRIHEMISSENIEFLAYLNLILKLFAFATYAWKAHVKLGVNTL